MRRVRGVQYFQHEQMQGRFYWLAAQRGQTRGRIQNEPSEVFRAFFRKAIPDDPRWKYDVQRVKNSKLTPE